MKRFLFFLGCCVFGLTVTIVIAQDLPPFAYLGGDNTIMDSSSEAFTNPLPLLTADQIAQFEAGDELFEKEWRRNEGLGPIYNAVSCEGCHIEDGRGQPPTFTGDTGTGLLFRLALNQQYPNASTVPDPIYGGQFQDDSIRRVDSEGTINITYHEINGTYVDGTPYTLYQPIYDLIDLNYGDLHSDITLSPRLAGQMIGLGLLEAIPESTLIALADPNDGNGDGISGRVNYVWDAVARTLVVGRFGWKANQPNLLQQAAGAFNGDMGITTSINPLQPCTDAQTECLNDRPDRPPRRRRRNNPPPDHRRSETLHHQDVIEATDDALEAVTFYTSTLAVPAQRNVDDPLVIQGQALFERANCTSCHMTQLQTGTHDIAALSNQTIHPYTDLLLHDMGAGLADGQPDFQATGTEWRTAPLWGIGLLEEVNGYAFYLHDGRARTLEEAIIWHGGEAEASRNAFMEMTADERAALVAFLKSL